MESVIFEDSPLALYLKGISQQYSIDTLVNHQLTLSEGDDGADHEWTPTSTVQPESPHVASFAPTGLPSRARKARRKPPRLLNLEGLPPKGAVAHFHHTCSVSIKCALCDGLLTCRVSEC